jgi:hypothetical protein
VEALDGTDDTGFELAGTREQRHESRGSREVAVTLLAVASTAARTEVMRSVDVEWQHADVIGEVLVQRDLQIGTRAASRNQVVDVDVEQITGLTAPATPIIPGIPEGVPQNQILRRFACPVSNVVHHGSKVQPPGTAGRGREPLDLFPLLGSRRLFGEYVRESARIARHRW